MLVIGCAVRICGDTVAKLPYLARIREGHASSDCITPGKGGLYYTTGNAMSKHRYYSKAQAETCPSIE